MKDVFVVHEVESGAFSIETVVVERDDEATSAAVGRFGSFGGMWSWVVVVAVVVGWW